MGKSLNGKELGTSFTQRKDGRYQARYKDRFGKTITIYNKNLRELKRQYALAIADNANCTSIRQEITLDAWFEKWVEIYKKKSVRQNTLRGYTHIYNKNISPYIGNHKINSLVKSDIQKLIDNAYDNGYSYESQNKIKVIITDMLERALEDELISRNPCKGVMLRSEKQISAKALSQREQKTFLEYCKGTFYENLFEVAINTGLRPGELFALTLDDINFETGFINVNKSLVYQKYLTDERRTFHVEPPKTKQSYRKVPINSVCRFYLEKQFELKEKVAHNKPRCNNDFLFVTRYNTPLNSDIYGAAIRSVIKTINRDKGEDFPIFGGHTFRHTFATRCFECGIQPKVIQSYLGHASLKMTMDLYTHVMEEKLSTDIENIVPK